MQCNIDAKGKAVRLLGGCISATIGLVVLGLCFTGVVPAICWVLGVALLAIGGFQIFEGWAGWCVLRAMGIRTRI